MSLPWVSGEGGVVSVKVNTDKSGQPWAVVRVACHDKTPSGEQGPPHYLDVVVFKPHAAHLIESVTVGDQLLFAGRLEMSNWTDRAGGDRQGYQVVAQMVGPSVVFQNAQTDRYRREVGREWAGNEPPF